MYQLLGELWSASEPGRHVKAMVQVAGTLVPVLVRLGFVENEIVYGT